MKDDSSGPRISVVIVTFNSANVLTSCLRALGHHKDFETIVVDNNSSDISAEIATKEIGAGRVLVMRENLGFGKAVNIGVSEKSASSRWVILLNPDAEIGAIDLLSMVEEAEKDPAVAVVSPMIRHPNGRLRVMPFGREPTIWRMFCHFSGLSRIAAVFPVFEGFYALREESNALKSVDWVSGACMAVLAEVWDALNGLSERWFMYAEDVEFCHRVRKADWKVVWDPSTTAMHWVGGSSSGEELSSNPAWIANLYDYYKIEISSSAATLALWRGVVAIGLFSRAGAFWLRGLGWEGRRSQIDWNREARRFAHFGRSVMSLDSTHL